jgi:Tfp pilus assembly protein PilN
MDPVFNAQEVTKPEESEIVKRVEVINEKVKEINGMMFYVVLILVVMVATLLVTVAGFVWNALQNQSATEQSLSQQINHLSRQLRD